VYHSSGASVVPTSCDYCTFRGQINSPRAKLLRKNCRDRCLRTTTRKLAEQRPQSIHALRSNVGAVIVSRRRNFLYSAQRRLRVVVSNLATATLQYSTYCVLVCFLSFVRICIWSISTVYFRQIKVFKASCRRNL